MPNEKFVEPVVLVRGFKPNKELAQKIVNQVQEGLATLGKETQPRKLKRYSRVEVLEARVKRLEEDVEVLQKQVKSLQTPWNQK